VTNQPRLSIVTVHWGELGGLEATQESICTLAEAAGVEWVVVDGGTQPGSEADRQILDSVRRTAQVFVSEPDEGLYDAMNKGTVRAGGRYVLFLNAGDLLHPGFHTRWLDVLPEPGPDMVWGKSWDRRPGGVAYPVHARSAWWLRWGPALAHQAILFRREALGRSPYDTRFRIAADYDLICRLYRRGGDILRLDLPVCIYLLGGRSAADKAATLREEAAIRQTHFGPPAWLNAALMRTKLAVWRLSERFPGLRRLARGRL